MRVWPDGLMRVLGALPLPLLRALGAALGWVLYAVVPERRHVVMRKRSAGGDDAGTWANEETSSDMERRSGFIRPRAPSKTRLGGGFKLDAGVRVGWPA